MLNFGSALKLMHHSNLNSPRNGRSKAPAGWLGPVFLGVEVLLFASQDSAVWVSLLLRSSQSLPKPGKNVEGILWRLVIGKPVNHTTPY